MPPGFFDRFYNPESGRGALWRSLEAVLWSRHRMTPRVPSERPLQLEQRVPSAFEAFPFHLLIQRYLHGQIEEEPLRREVLYAGGQQQG